MTEKQNKQIKSQLPQGERIDRMYTAFEGGIRVITKDANGRETRYNVTSTPTTMPVSRNSKEGATMWKEGSLKIHDSIFHYWMKQYDEGSQYGIEGGRVSKLMLKRNGEVVCNYDRGWDIKPSDPDTQLALELLLHSENF